MAPFTRRQKPAAKWCGFQSFGGRTFVDPLEGRIFLSSQPALPS
jgi:hypothetical protein